MRVPLEFHFSKDLEHVSNYKILEGPEPIFLASSKGNSYNGTHCIQSRGKLPVLVGGTFYYLQNIIFKQNVARFARKKNFTCLSLADFDYYFVLYPELTFVYFPLAMTQLKYRCPKPFGLAKVSTL